MRVVHRGGFGTCVPGAWTEHFTRTTPRTKDGDPHSRKPPAPQWKPRPGTRDCPTRPRAAQARGPGIKLREHGLNVPKCRPDRGAAEPARRNPTTAPPKSPARNPPMPDATNSRQLRGNRDRTPTWIAVITVGEKHPDQRPYNSGSPQQQTSSCAGRRSTAAQDERPQSTLWYSVPDSVHCSRASILPRPGLARDPVGIALAAPIPHGPRAGQ